eukprot:2354452-Pyramimonas_sp.AAC.1
MPHLAELHETLGGRGRAGRISPGADLGCDPCAKAAPWGAQLDSRQTRGLEGVPGSPSRGSG